VDLSVRPRHLVRYGEIGALILAHARGDWRSLDDPADAVTDDAIVADAERLARQLEAMGPTFVKLGQLLSTRADLLPPAYLEALARLQDDVEPVSFAIIEARVQEELGIRISQGFRSFDHVPLASASLGQVHKAVMRDGRPVVVKVQRPDIRDRIEEDMDVIEELAAFVDSHTETGRRLGFHAMVLEFRRSLRRELDYRSEAANLDRMADLLADHDRLIVPRPIDDYTTSTVLTMSYVPGRNVSTLGPLAQLDHDGAGLARDLFAAYLDQILVHGFFHADPHPGNVLLTDDGRLGLIDLGRVGHVAPGMQDDLIRLLIAVSEGDGEKAATMMVRLADSKREDYDDTRFRREVAALVADHQQSTLASTQAGRIVGELARIAAECGLRPPSEMTMIAKALLNLDEVARCLAPDLDPNAEIRDHVVEIMRRRMTESVSPGNLLNAALDAKEFAERFPSRVNQVMDALAEGQLTLNVQGIDEKELMRGIQKLANRVTMGVIVASLVIGGALTSRAEGAQILGYPALTMVLLAIAAAGALWLMVSVGRNDIPTRSTRSRR
jgi:predicted unusual protein kinase regulating ubiquinone biosynthesis (AarF/ABC1/UbiB family)